MHAKSLQSCPALCNPMACLAPLSMEFSRQEHWSGLPCPPPGDLPNPEIKLMFLMSPALASRFFTTSTTWEAQASHELPSSRVSPLALGLIVCWTYSSETFSLLHGKEWEGFQLSDIRKKLDKIPLMTLPQPWDSTGLLMPLGHQLGLWTPSGRPAPLLVRHPYSWMPRSWVSNIWPCLLTWADWLRLELEDVNWDTGCESQIQLLHPPCLLHWQVGSLPLSRLGVPLPYCNSSHKICLATFNQCPVQFLFNRWKRPCGKMQRAWVSPQRVNSQPHLVPTQALTPAGTLLDLSRSPLEGGNRHNRIHLKAGLHLGPDCGLWALCPVSMETTYQLEN